MVLTNKLKRSSILAAAALLFLTSLVPLMSNKKAYAYGLVTQRSIKMSSSKAYVAADPDVTYTVRYMAATTHTVKAIVVDFCEGASSPIIGDACTIPTDFTVGTPTVANQAGISGFTASSANSGRTLVLSDATGSSMTAATTIVSFDITTVKNPSATGTFYARITTFSTELGGGAGEPDAYIADETDTTDVIDAGGIALSTANQLTITAKVQERLTFCIYTTGTDCATGTGSSIIMGDTNGVLDDTTEYTNNVAKFGVSTNANGYAGTCSADFDPDATLCSVVIRMKGGTLKSTSGCADGSGQPCSINPLGATATNTPATGGSEQFGVCVGFTASMTPLLATTPYDGGAGTCDVTDSNSPGGTGNPGANTNEYAFDDNNTTGTQSPYGQVISTFNASTEKTGVLDFVANIAATTEPGVYRTTLTFIATGTY